MLFLKELILLFYPKLCVVCENQLLRTEKILCTFCRHDLPIIPINNFEKNKISEVFYGRVPIEKAASFLFYRNKGKTKKIIHALKYKDNQKIGVFIGDWFGKILNNSEAFNTLDYIIPVPLHSKKLKQRGYNQLDKFGKQLSLILKTPYVTNALIKTSYTKTQTFKSRFERFNNLETQFFLSDLTLFENKHVLLIDDVITTGATLEACCKELLKTKNIKISIVTMVFTD